MNGLEQGIRNLAFDMEPYYEAVGSVFFIYLFAMPALAIAGNDLYGIFYGGGLPVGVLAVYAAVGLLAMLRGHEFSMLDSAGAFVFALIFSAYSFAYPVLTKVEEPYIPMLYLGVVMCMFGIHYLMCSKVGIERAEEDYVAEEVKGAERPDAG